jgi:hypothetical protein
MRTKVSVVVLAVVVTTIAGCQDDAAPSAQTAAGQSSGVSAAPSTAAGNGVAALSADEILKRSKDALKQAKSFKVKGATSEEGQKINVNLQVDGSEFAGTMAVGAAKQDLLAVGGKKYMKGNEQFWILSTDAKQGKALAKATNGRWIAGADKDASFAEMFEIGSVDGLLKPTGALSKGEEKEIAGVPAIGLKDAGDTDTVLWIATTGEPYPLQLANVDGAKLVFSAFGEPATGITQPDATQIVDLGKVAGK